MSRLGSRDTAHHLAVTHPPEQLAEALAGQPVPVRVHRDLRRGVRDDRRRPLDRVDLRQHGGVDQARALKQVLVAPSGVFALEPVADRVVLGHEQPAQHAQPEPPTRDLGRVRLAVTRPRQQAVRADVKLAVGARPSLLLVLLARPVQRRAVPPMRLGVDERRRLPVGGVGTGRVGGRLRDGHRMLGPRVVVDQRHLPHLARRRVAVAEPVVDHELKPGGDERVQPLDRLELPARHELAADGARVRVHQGLAVDVRPFERDVAPEARARPPHRRVRQVVVGAVRRAGGRELRPSRRHRCHAVRRQLRRVVEVALAEDVPDPSEHGQPERRREPVPSDPVVGGLGELVEDPPPE